MLSDVVWRHVMRTGLFQASLWSTIKSEGCSALVKVCTSHVSSSWERISSTIKQSNCTLISVFLVFKSAQGGKLNGIQFYVLTRSYTWNKLVSEKKPPSSQNTHRHSHLSTVAARCHLVAPGRVLGWFDLSWETLGLSRPPLWISIPPQWASWKINISTSVIKPKIIYIYLQ